MRLALFLALLTSVTASAASSGQTLSELKARTQARAARLSESPASGDLPAGDHLLAAGRRELDAGEYPKAVATLREAAVLYRGKASEPAVLLALGQAYAAQKERTAAREQFDLLCSRFPRSDLADDAQFGKALLELANLPSPSEVLDAIREFATFNPLSLDADAIHHLLGIGRGYRLDRIGQAIAELERTWRDYPSGDRAADALLRQAVLEGFTIAQKPRALERLTLLIDRYPGAAQLPQTLVVRGFLQVMNGEPAAAATAFGAVPAESSAAAHAAFLAGLVTAYMLGELDRAQPHFLALSRSEDPLWRDLGMYHRALLSFATGEPASKVKKQLAMMKSEPRTSAVEAFAPIVDEKSRARLAAGRLATWSSSLSRTLDRIERSSDEGERRFAQAQFWEQAGHRGRAISTLREALERSPRSSAVPAARLALGRLLAQEPASSSEAAAALERAGHEQALPELALEARWRAAQSATEPSTALARLAQDGLGWRSRAIAELARRLPSRGPQRGRFLRELKGSPSGSAEQRSRLRDLADFLADEKHYRAALDLYRSLLPDDPALAVTMLKVAAMASASELTPSTAPGTVPAVPRALMLAETLFAAGEPEPALALLGQAAGWPGGSRARVALLVHSLEQGKLDLADMGRINALLEEKSLETQDRNRLLDWKARVLEKQGVDRDKALDLYRFLVTKGYDTDRLSILLARRAIAAAKFQEALTQLAKVPRGAGRDLAEALARKGLGEKEICRDRLVTIVSKHPSSPEFEEAAAELAAIDSSRLKEAIAAVRGAGGDESLHAILQSLAEPILPKMKPALEALAAHAQSLPGEAQGSLPWLGRALEACAAGGVAPARMLGLYQARLSASVPEKWTDRLALTQAMVASGRAREAYEQLEGKGPEAQLEQARLLRVGLSDPARGERKLRELLRPGALPGVHRALAAAQLAAWRRGEPDEGKLLEIAVVSDPGSKTAGEAWERLGDLAAARDDSLVAALGHDKASRCTIELSKARELALEAAEEYLSAGRDAEAARLAKPLLAVTSDDDLPARAREVLGVIVGRQQVEALERSLDKDDPENIANAGRLAAIARAQVVLSRDFDGAEATLLALSEQFPSHARSPEIGELRRTIERGRTAARERANGPRGLLRAGLLREEAREWREAVLEYGRAVRSTDGKGPFALLARLYAARVLALRLDDTPRAERLLADAAAQPEAPTFQSLLDSAKRIARAGKPRGTAQERARHALDSLGDPVMLEEALSQLPPAQSTELALEAGRKLDPLDVVTPLGPGRGAWLERAAALAPSGSPRARALLALALWRVEEGDPEAAADCLARAEKEAPGTEIASEAAARRGELLEGELADPASAQTAYSAALRTSGRRGTFQDLAAARLPIVLARREADAAESAGSKATDAGTLLAAARRQAKAEGQVDRAIENYLAFLRVGRDAVQLLEAHTEAAELLVRADRAREAVELLASLLDRRLPGTRTPHILLRMAEIVETGLADLPEAKRFYEEVRRVAPESTEARSAASGLKRIAEAGRAGERAEKAGEDEPASSEELETIRKKYLGAAKDPAGAAEALVAQIAVTKSKAEQAKLYLELAKVREADLNDYTAAAEAYSRAIDLFGPGELAAKETLRLATLTSEKLKQPKKAMELYDGWLRQYYANPKKVAVMLEKARLLETALDSVQVAIDTYRNIANGYPRSGYDEKALLRIAHLSRSYFADYRGAVDAYDQLARRFPFGPNAQTALLQAAQVSEIELGALDQAVAFYNRLVTTYPSSALAAEARGALARIERRRR